MCNKYNTLSYILQDKKNGKDNNWKERKENSLELAYSYKRLGFHKYKRVYDCSTFLEFALTVDKTLKLVNANFCKVRLCPMCAWRRSLKIFAQVSRIMDSVDENYNYRYIFLTLTVRNCAPEELKNTLNLMTQAFNRMNQRKAFKKAVKGYFRSLEVTYNRKDNTYHPHFHIILAVNKSYFTDPRLYISQEQWTNLWQDCLGVDYTPIVDVRRVEGRSKAVAETAKYTVKAEDYLIRDNTGQIREDITDQIVLTLDTALHRRRLISFGFLFKEIHKKLNLDDAIDGDLVDTDISLREDLTEIIIRYQWNIGLKNYVLEKVEENNK